jgi:hypothetical protein
MAPKHSQRPSPARPRLSPHQFRELERPLPLRAAASWQARAYLLVSIPALRLKSSRMHLRYFHDNVVFFRWTRFVHLVPGYGGGFLFSFTPSASQTKCNAASLLMLPTDPRTGGADAPFTSPSAYRSGRDERVSRKTEGCGSGNKYRRKGRGKNKSKKDDAQSCRYFATKIIILRTR